MSSSTEIKNLVGKLRHALLTGRLAHAYLITGRSRKVLEEAAEQILALMHCGESEATRPCGSCIACKQALARQHPDSLWVEPSSKSRQIVVSQIDEVLQHVTQTSFSGGWKTIVLMDADRLNEQSANKILKTLEEPPKRSLFLLFTNSPDEVLATILSRCQRLFLTSIDKDSQREAHDIILEVMSETDDSGFIAALERARLLQDKLKDIKLEITKIAEAELKSVNLEDLDKVARDKIKATTDARVEAGYRQRREVILEWLAFWQRDLLLCGEGAEDDLLAFKEAASVLRQAALKLDRRQILKRIQAVENMQSRLSRNIHETMVLEHGFVEMTQAL